MSNKKNAIKAETAEFDIKEMYTPFSVAKEEVWRRWNDKELRKKVEDYLGGSIPEPFRKEPRAVLSRSIITPNFECLYFLDLVKDVGIKPIGLEGVKDKFCTKNPDKVSLGKLSFYRDIKNKNKQLGKRFVNIIDMEIADGKHFCDIKTLWGEKLVDFHHRMLDSHDSEMETFDDFDWFAGLGRKSDPTQYYENFLALFLCFGILFENFHAQGKEKDFTADIIITNYTKILDIFGLKPLIVPLVPAEDERCLDFWDSYQSY